MNLHFEDAQTARLHSRCDLNTAETAIDAFCSTITSTYCTLFPAFHLLLFSSCACAGTCIGQSNRRIFVLYLSFQVAEAWWNSILAWDSFTKTTESHWLETNTTVLLVYLSLLFSLLLNVPLLLFQLYLISRNQSTWEFSRRNRISYLKSLPKGINPFDRGIFINCKAFWMHRFDDLNQKQRDIPEYLDSIVI